jgi:hypothetical protein
MASQQESPLRSLVASWPAVAAMAITVLSFLAAKPNLESRRPISVGVAATEEFRGYDVQVRLWQDPLGSVLNGPFHPKLENLSNGVPGPYHRADKVANEAADKVLILLAHVDIDMNAEQTETRRRERFATLAALNTAGYVPVKSDRISYVDFVHTVKPTAVPASRPISQTQSKNVMPELWKASKAPESSDKGAKEGPKEPPKGPPKEDARESRLRVAFEWLRPLHDDELVRNSSSVPRYRGVCVVWVWDDIDPHNSLRSLVVLKNAIARSLGKSATAAARYDFAVTGRISSSKLEVIRRDDKQLENDPEYRGGLKDVALYVTNSTAKSVRHADTDETLTNSKLHLKYVIGSDDLLLTALVAELENRGVSLATDHIALISEWDTAYGRAMHRNSSRPPVFRASLTTYFCIPTCADWTASCR